MTGKIPGYITLTIKDKNEEQVPTKPLSVVNKLILVRKPDIYSR